MNKAKPIIALVYISLAAMMSVALAVYLSVFILHDLKNTISLTIMLCISLCFGGVGISRSLRKFVRMNQLKVIIAGFVFLVVGIVWVGFASYDIAFAAEKPVTLTLWLVRMGGFWIIYAGAIILVCPIYVSVLSKAIPSIDDAR